MRAARARLRWNGQHVRQRAGTSGHRQRHRSGHGRRRDQRARTGPRRARDGQPPTPGRCATRHRGHQRTHAAARPTAGHRRRLRDLGRLPTPTRTESTQKSPPPQDATQPTRRPDMAHRALPARGFLRMGLRRTILDVSRPRPRRHSHRHLLQRRRRHLPLRRRLHLPRRQRPHPLRLHHRRRRPRPPRREHPRPSRRRRSPHHLHRQHRRTLPTLGHRTHPRPRLRRRPHLRQRRLAPERPHPPPRRHPQLLRTGRARRRDHRGGVVNARPRRSPRP